MLTYASIARLGWSKGCALLLGLVLCGRLAAFDDTPMPPTLPPAQIPEQPQTLPPVQQYQLPPATQATAELPPVAAVEPQAPPAEPTAAAQPPAKEDPAVKQTSCSTCGLPAPYHPEYGCGCGDGHGVPGHTCLHCDFGDGPLGRFLGCLYGCVCCPDPCYEPRWLPVADAGFFIDAARPKTQMRLRADLGWDFNNPDRAEWFWAKVRNNTAGNTGGIGPSNGTAPFVSKVDYQALNIYSETGTDTAGFFVETSFLHVKPNIDTTPGAGNCINFGDMVVGTKAIFLDCELLQLGTQFKTYIPTGNPLQGLGTGHVSLEPSLLSNLKISCDTYLQSQFAYWIPVGPPAYEGCIFHYHFSLNHKLWCPCEGIQLIGNGEMVGYHVFDGKFTNPNTGLAQDAKADMLYLGAGLRLFVCEKYDVGAGGLFAVTGDAWAREELRIDFRWRF